MGLKTQLILLDCAISCHSTAIGMSMLPHTRSRRRWPVGIKEFYPTHQEINQSTVAQAVLTGQGMARQFLFSTGQRFSLRSAIWR